MICGTAFGVAGVRHVQGHDIPWPGPILRRLLAAWSQVVEMDLSRQFLGPQGLCHDS
jgi:hypothetical protein